MLDPSLLIVEISSPEDKLMETLRRFREYENLGVRHILQMDPEDRTTYMFIRGDLVRLDDLAHIETPSGLLPFPAHELLALLDEE